MASIIIVEDERVLGQACRTSLEDDGHDAHWVANAEEALEWLQDRHADLALVDVGLPGMDGNALLARLAESHPDTAVIMMAAKSDVQTVVRAMRLGASDFLLKPLDLDALSLVAGKTLQNHRMAQTWRHEQKSRVQQFGLHQMIGECPAIQRAKSVVRRLAMMEVPPTQLPPNILITGETGTGKDLLARAFHYEGPRRGGPFVQVNCAALPEALAESELFGHVSGAFTSAQQDKRGLFEVADRGTLFLDETTSLPPAVQAKLLAAIETGRIRSVGSTVDCPVNVQLIAAMNEDPQTLVASGEFRQDLYHRLRVVHVPLPPLRERGRDIDLLTDHLLIVLRRRFGTPHKRLSPEARSAIRRYHWPGNVRELGHRLESAVLLSGDVIGPESLPSPRPAGPTPAPEDDGILRIDFARGPISLLRVEQELIRRAMIAADHNVSRAAALLDLSRDTLRYRLEKYGMTREEESGVHP